MLSLLDLGFVLCSRNLDVLRAQRIIGFFLNYPQINGASLKASCLNPSAVTWGDFNVLVCKT